MTWRSSWYAVLTAVVVLFVGGCASGPTYQEVAPKLPKLAANEGRIWLIRADRFGAAAVQPEIRVNGVVVGRAQVGGMFFVDRPPGTYEVAGTTEVEKKLTFALTAGEEKYVRLQIAPGLLVGRLHADLIDRQTAERDMSVARYTGEIK
jgi:hypothetical protein